MYYLVLNYFLEKKKYEHSRKRYFPKVMNERIKSQKRKKRQNRDNNDSKVEPNSDLINEPPQQGIKLLVSYSYIVNFKII